MFVLIQENHSFDKKILNVNIVGYSSDEQLLRQKSNDNNIVYENAFKNYIPYQERQKQYNLKNPPPKMSEIQDANPQLNIPSSYLLYQKAYSDWETERDNIIGISECEPIFHFFTVSKIEEIT